MAIFNSYVKLPEGKNYSPGKILAPLIIPDESHFGVAFFWTKSKQKPNLAKTPKGPVETTN